MTQNWKEIHEAFGCSWKNYQKQWEGGGFDYPTTKQWIEVGLKPREVLFAIYLRDIKHLIPEQCASNIENLSKEYNKIWTDIHPDFAKETRYDEDNKICQWSWEEWGLTYQDAQEWIPVGFKPDGNSCWNIVKWKNLNFTSQEAKPWIDFGLSGGEAELVAYCRSKGYQLSSDLDLEKLSEAFNNWEKESKSAQEYLDIIYSKEQRNAVKWLDISHRNLKGDLSLDDFIDLKIIDCSNNQLTNLSLPEHCSSLVKLDCRINQLTNLDFLLAINPEKLKRLDIRNNNFSNSVLSIFSSFTNLESLRIGNGDEKINQNIYNHFYGSLEPLKVLTKLWELDIDNTDIDNGWEYLPESLRFDDYGRWETSFSSKERPESKVKEIEKQLNEWPKWISKGLNGQQLKAWIDFGLQPEDYDLAAYLTKQGYHPQNDLNLEELRKEYHDKSQKSQEWLSTKYPHEKRSEVEKIYLNEPSLEGELDLGDFTYYNFTYYRGIKIYISSQVDETKLAFKNLPKSAKIVKLVQAQHWLAQNYPQNGTCIRREWGWMVRGEQNHPDFGKKRSEITELEIKGTNLCTQGVEGHLNLNDFTNLKKLNCSGNELTSLDLANCEKLEEINFWGNQLTNLTLLSNPINLKKLNLSDNNFPIQNLSFLVSYTSLESLNLSNNKFTGSLDYLSGMEKLRELNIGDTDLNEVNIDKLPRDLEKIEYSTYQRPDCKLTEIVPQLEKVRYGWCSKCLQPNTSEKWCHPCADQELQILEQLTGRKLVEKFIQRQQISRLPSGSKFRWIPYEQFTNIEQIGEGGFSKIYKAKRRENYDNRAETIALKSFTNSQNIIREFLKEMVNYCLIGNWVGVMGYHDLHGISQDPVTKNYVMVMDYKKDGDLRKCLQSKSNELSLKDRLDKLRDISRGLSVIHEQNLVHRDLHSGNVLNDRHNINIADLGLSQPANYQKEEGKIFGVIPYIAPEVFRGQSYTQKSDIYSFGIMAYELLANAYPYTDLDLRETDLSLAICNGLRPNIDKIPTPQLLKDFIKKCWDDDPKKRPSAKELLKTIDSWQEGVRWEKDSKFYQQYQGAKGEYNAFSQNTPYQIHSNAATHSKLINTKEIARLLQNPEKQQQALELELKKLEKEIGKSFTDEQKELVKEFIQVKKRVAEGKEEESKVWELEDQLIKEKEFSQKDVDKITIYCDRLVEQLEKLQLQAQQEITTNK